MTQTDPFSLFQTWFDAAAASEPNDPNAMALATSTPDGFPSVRMVLLKGHDANGFVFYTNMESRKGGEILANRQAALLFHWKSLRRQIRIEGALTQVDDAEADAYFASRARDSQIGAWASAQSRPLSGRTQFLADIAKTTARFGIGNVPRPPHWTGFRLTPQRFEFWQDQAFRLHDRHIYVRKDGGWDTGMLYP